MTEMVIDCFKRIMNKNELPKITPHVARHTFCSKMAKAGMDPKALQYIMGHTRIDTTLNVIRILIQSMLQKKWKKYLDKIKKIII